MKKALLFTFLAIASFPTSYSAKAEPRPVFMNPESTVETSADRKRCARKVLMTMGGTGYALSRTRLVNYTKMDGTKIVNTDPKSPATNCFVVDVGEVSGFGTGFKTPTDYDIEAYLNGTDGAPKPPPTTYDQNKKLIEDAVRDLKFNRKADGVRQMNFGRTAIYLLPRNIAPTADQQPAAVICNPDKQQDKAINEQKKRQKSSDTNERMNANRENKLIEMFVCRAHYIHPNGLSFGYTYFEKKPGDHLALDLYIRKRFEALKYDPANPPPDVNTIPLEEETPPAETAPTDPSAPKE